MSNPLLTNPDEPIKDLEHLKFKETAQGRAVKVSIVEGNLSIDGDVTIAGDSKISGTVDGTSTGTERTFINNRLIQLLSAHDVVKTFTWLDFGTKNERVSVIAYASAALSINATRTFSYTSISGGYRLDTDTWSVSGGA